MRLFSYVVARDYGFAPNPFFGTCTLATCKPLIRKAAEVGDLVLGTGSKSDDRERCVIFAMRVTETLSFNEFWRDGRFQCKKPNLAGSRKQAFGDNIYHQSCRGEWLQANSHHSRTDGSANQSNVQRDTRANTVLVSDDFLYWGGDGPPIPARFDVCKRGPGHRCNFPIHVIESLDTWLRGQDRVSTHPRAIGVACRGSRPTGYCVSRLSWSEQSAVSIRTLNGRRCQCTDSVHKP